MSDIENLQTEAISLLKSLIETQSFSREEDKTAQIIQDFLEKKNVKTFRKGNNVWAYNAHYSPSHPTVLLNSHHDTVKPNKSWTIDPLKATESDGKLFGLGSNDAGGALVSLISAFLYFYDKKDLKYNICIAATAEEEISGNNGVEMILEDLRGISFGIVGEPTQMHLAIAEKGLMVLDCVAHGKAGHAARNEGENAIYKAMKDIEWFRTYQFPKTSEMLGPVKMSVTIIQSGTQQHNVVPDRCEFTVDVRTIDAYSNEEVMETIKQNVSCEIKSRSFRLKPSSISKTHAIVKAGIGLGRNIYGSPTTSDQALMDFPTLKLGPGDSARSHMADEYIFIDEVKEGIDLYIKMLEKVVI